MKPCATATANRGGYGALIVLGAMALIAGCATSNSGTGELAPVSIQTLQYYPFQVKGYQKSFPAKKIIVLAATDARTFKDAGAGIRPSPTKATLRSAFSWIVTVRSRKCSMDPILAALVTDAIAQSANEAGMVSSTSACRCRLRSRRAARTTSSRPK